MSNGLKLFISIILFAQITQAQVILMIDDETKSGFKLVMNGFLQNETALPKLNLQKFPEGINQVTLLISGGLTIKRALPQLDDGIHKYVIYRDYNGDLRFRYRGLHSSLSQSALMIDYHIDSPYIDADAQNISTLDTLSNYPKWKAKQEAQATLAQVDTNTKRIPTTGPQERIPTSETASRKPEELSKAPEDKPKVKPTETLVSDDSITNSKSSEVPLRPKKVQAIEPYPNFLAAFKSSEFEFDKLKLAKEYITEQAINPQQAETILKGLKYDQSRLDFLQYLLTKQSKLKASQETLIACFDYDLTKEQAKKLFQQ